MVPSLEAFLAGLIDYAGLFPPARLPLGEALANYARYRREPRSWMLGRFIVPAARLAELPPSSGPTWSFAALGRGGATATDFLDGLRLDLEVIDAAHDRAVVDVLEVKLPPDAGDRDAIRGLLVAVAEVIYETQRPSLRAVFYESVAVVETVAALAEDNALGGHARHWKGGLKMRCGALLGPSPYPSAEQVARALTACRDAGVPFKATAGLHHPLPRSDATGQMMHGFLNLFGAGVLAHARGLGVDQVRSILDDRDATHFVFDEKGFAWKDFRATTEEVTAAREKGVLSFGSCSFDEPCDDLRELGFLD